MVKSINKGSNGLNTCEIRGEMDITMWNEGQMDLIHWNEGSSRPNNVKLGVKWIWVIKIGSQNMFCQIGPKWISNLKSIWNTSSHTEPDMWIIYLTYSYICE